MAPWRDRSGRISAVKLIVFALLFGPGAWLALGYATATLGPRPFTEMIHETGLWAFRLLLISLAVTPLRQVSEWPRLIVVRRMIGVASAAYAGLHLAAYAMNEAFDLWRVASEIVLRFYLAIGFMALMCLGILAATSTDGMIRRLGGGAWRNLHRLAYGIGLLAVIHYLLQSKADVSEPTVMAGLYCWLMGYRLIDWLAGDSDRAPLRTAGMLTLTVTAATAASEAMYFWLRMGVDPTRVLAANLSLAIGIRPAWFVLIFGAVVVLVGAWRILAKPRPALPPATAALAAERTGV
jgi:sulfoxide reductase heme-binding subunit YedZ